MNLEHLGVLGALAALLLSSPADAQTRTLVDRTVVRFYAPETGGSSLPRFVGERVLAFEARLEAMTERTEIEGYADRHVRAALEHDVSEQMLARLGDKLVSDLPAERRPKAEDLARESRWVADAIVERLGGRVRVDAAARTEGLDGAEVDALLGRAAAAAWYLDRAVAPLLHPSDEQLRDVYRTSAHPYRAMPFEQARAPLERWFVVERLRVAEAAFLQTARSRVHIAATP